MVTRRSSRLFADSSGLFICASVPAAVLLREIVPDATADVTAGNTDFAAIPLENTPGGAVTSYIDAHIAETSRNKNAD